MRILVTGSSGMIGTNLVDALTREGHDVVGLDIREPVANFETPAALHDLRNPIAGEALQLLTVKPIDIIVHLAANARVYELVLDPDRAFDNIAMTHRIFEFARMNKIPRLLFASSRETYGNGQPLPVHESATSQRNAESAYSVSKVTGEGYCYAYSHCYGVDARIMRYSNVYGRNDMSNRFIPKAILHLLKNEPFPIYGKEKTLDFTYLDDAVQGTVTLITKWDDEVQQEREYNIASGEQVTLYDVAHTLKSLLNSDASIVVEENLVGEVMNYQADITRMRGLGWEPETSLDAGLAKAIEHYREAYANH